LSVRHSSASVMLDHSGGLQRAVVLLLTPRKAAAVPRLIMSLRRRYVQYINRTHGRSGTLWDSRYKSSVIRAETYLLCCQRYIELNPVRAAMVSDPSH
jgi:putative transposase